MSGTGRDRLYDCANGRWEVGGRFDGREIGQQHGPPSPGWPHATKDDFHRPRIAANCRGYRRRQDGRGVVNADLVQGQQDAVLSRAFS